MTIPRQPDEKPAVVLLVDDNPTNRYVLGTTLRRAGHQVVEAADGQEGLARAADPQVRPEVVLVDVRLPDMTGFEVCERIKVDPRTASLPVIHVSASAISASDRTQGLNRGADAYLTEPIAPSELLATVTATLRYTRARRRAELLADRLSLLNRTTLRLHSALSAEALARSATEGAAAVLACPVDVLLTDPEGRTTHFASAGPGAPAERIGSPPLPPELFERHPLGDAVGAAVESGPSAWPIPFADGDQEAERAVALARTKPGRPPAAVVVPAAAVPSSADTDLLTQLTHTTALALEALRSYDEEHTLALKLQRSFLPEALPSPADVELAVRYAPASRHAEIGGDFYEAVQTPEGLVLAVGDVAGHSLEAAMVMGQVRHALRAYALDGHRPDGIQTRLEKVLAVNSPVRAATLCIVQVDRVAGVLRISNAGHIPPVVRSPDGTTTLLHDHGPLLGLDLPHPPPAEVPLLPGTEVVLVTDGLIERRGVDLDEALEALRAAVASGPVAPGATCDALLAAFPPDGEDDVAILAARLR
ncbi:SpoIIE family protein phosphatase [Streptomyces albidoflavus]|uniref:SpoIIE family protein phosphatase n=1 Tax=Streptomyces albidoflavus TaxID=1886 RepID=UPI003868BB85|nr:SpoIIE family protein phosphatase [Streptomyces albidoflavus]WTD42337.1 SpoIIE family protein phosphatase [Streptomyces albidoflavus]WTD83387.1 SpoIIE family protein phosphatase [Streptomyces albidoflavus]